MSVRHDPDSDIRPKELRRQIQQINKEIENKDDYYRVISEHYDPSVLNSTRKLGDVREEIGELNKQKELIEHSLPEQERPINLTEKPKPKHSDDKPVYLPKKVKPNTNNNVFSRLLVPSKGGKTRRKTPKKRTRVKRRKQSKKSRRIRS